MDAFMETTLAEKRVSVWGIGYLGYTSVMLLQAAGFFTLVHALEDSVLDALEAGEYPGVVQRHGWSRGLEIPRLNFDRLHLARAPEEMFASKVHIFAFPSMDKLQPPERLTQLFELFKRNLDKLDKTLVLFTAAEMPGALERYFVDPLRALAPGCSCATAMRLDWTLEEFLCPQTRDVVSGMDELSRQRAEFFLRCLRREHITLPSLKDAEIHAAAARALKSLTTAFFNQLSLAYPDADIAGMAPALTAGLAAQPPTPSLATLGGRFANSTEFLLDGSARPGRLTLLQAAQSANLSILMEYAEVLVRQDVKSVAVFGLSVTENQKNAMMSPAFVLAEHLHGLGIKTFLNDPFFSPAEIKRLLPFAAPLDLDGGQAPEALVFLTDHERYRQISRRDFDRPPFNAARIIIDNPGVFKGYAFAPRLRHHVIGSGTLNRLL